MGGRSEPLVGRERESASLDDPLDAVAAGAGRFVLVSGDPGIGKTRLLDELGARARERGFTVAVGRPLDEVGAEPYALLAEAVEPVVGEALGDWLAATPRAAGDEHARAAFFERVADALAGAAAEAPLVLILDDVQWADLPTVRFLDHLDRAPVRAVLVAIGHRPEAAAPGGTLAELGPRLRAGTSTSVIDLVELGDDQVVALAERAAGRALAADERTGLVAEAQGNPLFAQEIARALGPSGGPPGHQPPAVPGAVRASITARVEGLPEEAAEALRAAAVLGAEFAVAPLAAMEGASPEDMLLALEPAERVGLLTASPRPGHLAFGHPLIWRLVYDGLTARERAVLHLRAAEALAGTGGGAGHSGALAFHYGRAAGVGGADLAVTHARRAGDHAAAQLAFEDAVRFYGDALALAGRGAALAPAEQVELTLRRAASLVSAGAMSDGRAQFADAATAAEAIGDRNRLARGALGRAGYRGTPGAPDIEAIALLERSLAAPADDPLLVAQVAARQAMELYYLGERERRERLSSDAVASARRGDDGAVLAQVLVSRHYAINEVANVAARTEVAVEAARLAEANGDADTAMRAHYLLIRDLLEVGDRAGAEAAAQRLRVLAGGASVPLHAWRVRLVDALFAHLDGDLERAERHADDARHLGVTASIPNAEPSHFGMLFLVRAEQGRLGELVPQVRAGVAAYPTLSTWGPMLAWALLEAGDRAEAKAMFATAVAGLASLVEDEAFLPTGYVLAAVAVALEDRSAAAAILARFGPFADRVGVVTGPTGCTGPAALGLSRLAGLLGRLDEASAHLGAAAALAERLDSSLWRAHVADARTRLERRGLPHPAGLTDREVEVLRLLAAGRTNREAATALGVGVRTVDSHVSAIYRKVGARGRVDAVAFAIANGLVEDPP